MSSDSTPKPIASVSLDIDNQWSYMKVHGDAGWESYPSYLPVFLPYVLSILQQLDLTITFFIVGKDADCEINKPFLQQIVTDGHEVGNHSYHHESWLQSYTKDRIDNEIQQADDAIIRATGIKPSGFRGPGFSWSSDLLLALEEQGYKYDTSTLPTYIGPLARQYYFMTAKLSAAERKARKELFGSFSDGLRPVKQYFWMLSNGKQLLEIPVTTIPIIKTPFHLSYLLYLSGFSMLLMRFYLTLALGLCRLTKTTPNFLLHPLDLLGGDQISELRFFPGMNIDSEKKLLVFRSVIKDLQRYFTLVPMGSLADQLQQDQTLEKIPCQRQHR
jgi:peptidoglycan-N-acetylglucosamine deacetylase